MRALSLLAVLVPLALSGCPDSHGRGPDDDAGLRADGGGCAGASGLICVPDCRGDAGVPPICSGDRWTCPPGTRDIFTCPPTCFGPPPAPGCTCSGTEWSCPPTTCPPGIDPWNPDAPGNACAPDGVSCSSGGTDSCGAGLWCQCSGGRWSCAFAEPDPVCWCGREPSEGDRCNEEGASCGECCPTPGGTGWPAMTCEGGHWAHAACPDVECPPVIAVGECPVDPEVLLGRDCSSTGLVCGHACCEGEIVCEGGVWVRGLIADCAVCPETECGEGTCRPDQYCHRRCGPDDGTEHVCQPSPEGCTSCDCIPLWGTQTCEMVDGHPVVRDLGLCG